MKYEFDMIKKHYGNQKAERSGVPLINHIREGLGILNRLGANQETKAAFCLHPLLQSPEDYELNRDDIMRDPKVGVLSFAHALAYRNAANAYLCREQTDGWTQLDIANAVGHMHHDIKLMLIADKEQNQKDFLLYHYGTHNRSDQLLQYFHNWLEFLGVPELKGYQKVTNKINTLDVVFGNDDLGRTASLLAKSLKDTNHYPEQISIIVSEESSPTHLVETLIRMAREESLPIDNTRLIFATPDTALDIVDDLIAHTERVCLYVDAVVLTSYVLPAGDSPCGLSFSNERLQEAAEKATQVSATCFPPKKVAAP